MGLRGSGQSPVSVLCILITAMLRGLNALSKNDTEILFIDDAITAGFDSDENSTSDENFILKNEGCVLPSLDILDLANITNYPMNITPCSDSRSPLLGHNESHIWIIRQNYPLYNITNEGQFDCCYKTFQSIESTNTEAHTLSNTVKNKHCNKFKYIIPAHKEFMRVICSYGSNVIYDQFFIFAQRKHFTEYRQDPFKAPENQTAFNVILLGMSSISGQNFHKTMPHTLKLLRDKQAVQLMGYNKVSNDDRFSNLMPVLVGMSDVALRDTYWRKSFTFDRCPFIWERFKDEGYYTALLEDSAKLSIFNTKKFAYSGFNSNPTDYYMYPFIKEAEMVMLKKSPICLGNKYLLQVMLDYIFNLTNQLKSSKLFAVCWESSMSHNYLEYPMLMDHSYESLIKKLDNSGYLNDTILILLSDQGFKVDEVHKSEQKLLKQDLPLVYILAPPSFREKYSFAYENLKRNSRHLSTPFDIHNTLVDLINLNSINNDELVRRSKLNYAEKRAISLFLPIPSDRTCKSAEIKNSSCTCLKNVPIPTNSVIARDASIFLIKNLNHILENYPQCAPLSVERIIDATEMANLNDYLKEWRIYRMVVRTMPGAGVFEAILRRDNFNWTIAGSVIRRNLYGNQSRCVKKYKIKMYCHCR